MEKTRVVHVGKLRIGGDAPPCLIAGPCVIESLPHLLKVGRAALRAARGAGFPFILKSSYDKANRTSHRSYRGPGLREGLRILGEARRVLGVPVLTDVHSPEEAEAAGEVVDVLQIPAFLCRQTDLILAAARTGKAVNIKKGQFLAPWDVKPLVAKALASGNPNILVTERGTSFGYNTLVNDFRALPVMRRFGAPVIFDVTHSTQSPGGRGDASGGDRTMAPYLAAAAAAVGCDGLFMEVHDDPDHAPSDGPNMIRLADLPRLLKRLRAIFRAARA